MMAPISKRLVWSLLLAASAMAAGPGAWSEPVDVYHDEDKCISYQARRDGDLLVVRAKLNPGWHTFVMDNAVRATEKLAGKQSLGQDQPTKFTLTGGPVVTGPWKQSKPKDFSKPDQNWFSWGYESEAWFVAPLKGNGKATIAIRGQSCSDRSCRNVDVKLQLPAATAKGADSEVEPTPIADLIEVRTK